ncbi:TadE/TadG family type IV pilus assembly protein [uncultured Rhodoblastus sp.]|uniref:TadE/TadG family type IV pilus assembly protein n=1 Tax=uncultured Rhodoblastus sp. TaxID=543037 RepID=UPI0025D8B743|nr:TadE/TadG family type IV pilus assembly protein [uncultured Rhodoblastus sp.]
MTLRVALRKRPDLRWRAWLRRGESGMAAVEFALILPMMLALYFGGVMLAQGLDARRKTQTLSRTLADLAAQTLPAPGASIPVLADADILNIFAAAPAVLYPLAGTTNMTISEIVFDNVSASNSQCCVAKVLWSVGSGPNPTLRQCPTLLQSLNGVNGAGVMPVGAYPPTVASGNTTDTYVIVADVTYAFSPGFGFQNNNWSNGSTYVLSRTTYMSPRNGASAAIRWTPGGAIPSSNYVVCTPNTP